MCVCVRVCVCVGVAVWAGVCVGGQASVQVGGRVCTLCITFCVSTHFNYNYVIKVQIIVFVIGLRFS